VAVAYLTAVNLDGAKLVLAWAAEATALAQIARRSGTDRLPAGAALCFLGGAGIAALALAPPKTLLYGLDQPLAQAAALGAVALAALRIARVRLGGPPWPLVLASTAGLVVLYLASAAVVTPFQPAPGVYSPGILDVGIRQQGQVLMSALWAVAGLAIATFGLRRDDRTIRLAGLTLTLSAVGKVFMFDLAALSSIYRVMSFIALGLLLLTGAFVWQRIRPRPLPDLRTTQ
jgi:hypothetical protein